MKKLKLEELAPYLPYGLKIKLPCGEIITMSASLLLTDLVGQNIFEEYFNTNKSKPILRPLSDLTKEMIIKGRKYCVLELWLSIDFSEENAFKQMGTIPDYWKAFIDNINLNGIKRIDYGFIQILLEHHFDVFGLIEKDLAIDINTLKL